MDNPFDRSRGWVPPEGGAVMIDRKRFRYHGVNHIISSKGTRFHLIGKDHVLSYTPPHDFKHKILKRISNPKESLQRVGMPPGRWAADQVAEPGGRKKKTNAWPDESTEYVGRFEFEQWGTDQPHIPQEECYAEIRPIELCDLMHTRLGQASPPSPWVSRESGLSWNEESQVLDIDPGAVFKGIRDSGRIDSVEGWAAFVIADTTIGCVAKYISGWKYAKEKGFPVRIVGGTTPEGMTHSVRFQNGSTAECFVHFFPTPQRFLDRYRKAFRHADLHGDISRRSGKAPGAPVNSKQACEASVSLIKDMVDKGEIQPNTYNWQELAAKIGYPPGKASNCGKSLRDYLVVVAHNHPSGDPEEAIAQADGSRVEGAQPCRTAGHLEHAAKLTARQTPGGGCFLLAMGRYPCRTATAAAIPERGKFPPPRTPPPFE